MTNKLSQHTPGPWWLSHEPEDNSYDIGAGDYVHAWVKLFSAAPDLLGACKLALDDFIHGHNFTTTQDKLADAIAKAEGKGE